MSSKSTLHRLFALTLAVMVFCMLWSAHALALTVYFNDFESGVGPEWSSTAGTLTIATTPSGRNFLGRDPFFGLHQETVSLSFTGLPPHFGGSLSFDLYIIDSWDGIDNVFGPPFPAGPDVFTLSIASGPTLLNTTFANWPGQLQNFPDSLGGPTHPLKTGASEINTLGYNIDVGGDAVYHLVFSGPHTGSSLTFNFSASLPDGAFGIDNESWGIDNVTAQLFDVPEPSSLMLLGSGLAGLAALRRRRKAA